MAYIFVSLLIAALALAALAHLIRQVLIPADRPMTPEWLDELSTERYRPMLRLLRRDDFDFLADAAVTRECLAKLRVQRCQIFRAYLLEMDADFRQICTALKAILLHSHVDRPDLASALLRNQLAFGYRKITLHIQVLLFQYEIGTVDVSDLVKLFDSMRMELHTLVPAGSAATA